MVKKLKPNDQTDSASAALQHAVLSIILLAVIMGSLIQISHMLIENRDTLAVMAFALPH